MAHESAMTVLNSREPGETYFLTFAGSMTEGERELEDALLEASAMEDLHASYSAEIYQQAGLKMQTAARGYLGRKEVGRRRLERKNQNKAAVRIQGLVRGYVTRATYMQKLLEEDGT